MEEKKGPIRLYIRRTGPKVLCNRKVYSFISS